jgi:hypothetical protein
MPILETSSIGIAVPTKIGIRRHCLEKAINMPYNLRLHIVKFNTISIFTKTNTMKNLTLITLFGLLLTGCSNYGTKLDFEGDELYYKEPVTEEVATNVAQFLKDYQYFTGQGFSVQVLNENGYRIRFVTKEGVENDEEVTGGFKFLLIDLCNSALKGEPADIDLCDEQLKTKSSITYTEAKSYMEQKLLEAQ